MNDGDGDVTPDVNATPTNVRMHDVDLSSAAVAGERHQQPAAIVVND